MDLLERCRKGDEEAFTELLVSLTPLVRYLAHKLGGVSREEQDDLIQEGYISIIDAVKGYESARGKFSSYSFSCIRNRMISLIRKNRNRFHLVPFFPESHENLEYPGKEDRDMLPDLHMEELFSGLTFLETTVLDAYLETGSTSRSGEILGWPRKKVDNALQRIRKKILRNMDGFSRKG